MRDARHINNYGALKPFRFLYSGLFGLMLTALRSWSAEGASAAWTLQPFESDAARLIAAVNEIKVAEGQDVKIPLRDVYFSIDEHHREIERLHMVFSLARVEHSKFALNLAKDFQAQYPDSYKAN